ncbi:efflux RND transporter periplasmic adaptor subunit [Gilvimarinus sp. DA14]|uniref:efflux RND transporter periplasmic adaptor subunit n=1 Tax=Gilvimarinus sp. DA14 TaxID=2956798 RepID=UPI0020B7CA6E|nr:efflux RND transporter periplasmic adaptor subunit [Gilvimarinus sp. DA14]UTF59775.1 efflux RND transporter periplasmic adaptor subunit [Gilvimarinus sp. DA14]
MKSSAKQRLVAGAWLLSLWFVLTACTDADKPLEKPAPRLVDAARVEPANGASQVSLSGRVRAVERTVLSFEVGGEIKAIHVDVGDAVEQGQVLASLHAERYQLVLKQAQAQASEAKAALTEKELDYSRLKELQGQGFVSKANLDTAKAALDTAQSRYRSAQASVNIAERDVALTELKAPFSGSISERVAQPAQRVAPNEPVLEAISERGGFEVYTHVPEALVGKLRRGSEQQVLIPALSQEKLRATIEHIGTRPESSNNYPVVLALSAHGSDLRAGMTAQALLSPSGGKNSQGSFLVPLTALVHGEQNSVYVLRIKADRTLEQVDVEIIEPRVKVAEVRGALTAGDQIVARGAEFVAPGETVEIMGQGPERFN